MATPQTPTIDTPAAGPAAMGPCPTGTATCPNSLTFCCCAALPAAQRQAVAFIERHPLQAILLGLGIGTLAWLLLRQDRETSSPVTP